VRRDWPNVDYCAVLGVAPTASRDLLLFIGSGVALVLVGRLVALFTFPVRRYPLRSG
jgi:hypothetical protein